MTTPDPFSSPKSRGITPVDANGRAKSAVGVGRGWQYALDVALDGINGIVPDAVIVFASAQLVEDLPRISEAVWHHSGSMIVIGCASSGVIGQGIEFEDEPAISLVALDLPGAILRPVRFTQGMLESASDGKLAERIGVDPALVNGWFVLADPFKMDGALLVERLNAAYPGLPVVGGLLAPAPGQRETWVLLNGQTYGDGGVGLSIGGAFDLMPIVSQGCEPIGEAWTITAVEDKWIETISNRPALQLLTETLATLPMDMQLEAHDHLVAGLAANEYRETFGRGDFLIRNIIGIRRETGEIAIGARPRVGQTIQFQLRDAATADLDLTATLLESQLRLGGREPVAGLLASCNGRGSGMFGTTSHDANAIERRFPGLPLGGLIAAGEIGPVGSKTFIHGFTSSLGLIVPS
ncbi:MAG TPA: FIST N-terminal domain-containing protein [Thermomicrobiales bacterium]|nr:FIST N-terminal domain-containing protein [Thermomicrobiales bacterium]